MMYFDHAATSFPKPRPVERALARSLREYGGNPGRGAHRLSLASAEMIYDCRCELCDLFGAEDPAHVIFCGGATAALNMAILSRVRRGTHILMSDREHNAVRRTVLRLASEGIAEYSIFSTGEGMLSDIEGKIRENTEILVACHVSNVTGFTLPIERIGALCRRHGIFFIVDAAQSAGHTPLHFPTTLCDALCLPAHKGLLGISGLGALILGKEGGTPLLVGGSGVDSLSPDMPSSLPERYEAGTLPTPAIAALRLGVRYLRAYGIERLEGESMAIKKRLLAGLSEMRGITLYEPDAPAALVAFTHEGLPPEVLAERLDRVGICVRAGYHCAPLAHKTVGTPDGGCVRLSLGYGNTLREADKFLTALSRILREG